MKRIVLCMLLFLLTFLGHRATAQNYNISNSTVSTCGGNFYDSGGAGANYANNENYVMTFCSSVPGECIRVTFSDFDLENGPDYLTVYNGATTAAPVLGSFTGTALPAMLTSTTGCLTFEFVSDFSIRGSGFVAALSCVPCPGSACPSCNGGAPPANDACSGAMNLGQLPVPAACPNGVGAWANFNTTNICATAESPYTTLTGCQPAGNMASPATDVWYRFNITGPTLNISIAGMQTPNVGLYAGTNCNNLVGRGCAIGGGGVLNTSFGGLAPGTYYLQISGGNLNDQCAFTLSLQNNYDCAGCVIQSSFTANPPPTNGTYQAGQTVTFCYSVTDYNQTSVNWLHGIVPSFGAGWDMTTLVTNPPVSCSGQGTWSWYNNNITSTATGSVTGPGFYFESALGNVLAITDGNPGNNFGDNNPNNLCDWTFCWTITTLPPNACVQGASLNITVDTYGDGESGSWTSLACTGDAVADFFATLTCCVPPVVAVTNPLCFGSNTGSATGNGQGNAPWDYIWKNNAGVTIQTANNVNGSNNINNLAPGNYTLTCVDNTGCSATTNFTIVAPTQITVNTVPIAATCNGGANGSATANANGGTPGYTYLWAPSGGTGSVESGLSAGTYTVTVTDANGCTKTAQAVITQPNPINIVINTVNANCGASNGSVTIVANGGTGALQYSINGGVSFQAGASFNNLASGNYNVVVKDASGCLANAVAQVNNSQAPVINSIPVVNVTCNGGSNGSFTINASGGTGALQYSINNGASFQAAINYNGLAAGNYNVIVQDANNCQATMNVVITEPPVITVSLSSSDPICGLANGTVTVSAGGGTGALQYSINGGPNQAGTAFNNLGTGNYTVTVTDANGCTAQDAITLTTHPPLVVAGVPVSSTCGNANGTITINANGGTVPYTYSLNGGPGQSITLFQNLAAGNYNAQVTDSNGCTATIPVVVTNLPGPTITGAPVTDVTCFGGSNGVINVTTSGGTPALQYSLNGGPFQSTALFDTLYSGNYSITVQDANGCVDVINVTVSEPPAIITPWISQNSTCGLSNGSVTVNATGGTGVIMYSLNGGPFQASNTFNGLSAGNYDITVQDENGCIVVVQTAVSNVPGPVIPSVTLNMVTCNGGNDGTLNINTVGGTLPFQYSINNGASYEPDPFYSGLIAGSYDILVVDSNGCIVATNAIITEPTLITVAENITGTTCGNNNGAVTLVGAGGTGALQYSLSGGPWQASGSFNNLLAGNYNYSVQDANNCIVNGTFVIPDAPGPVVTNTSTNDALCNGSSDGIITVVTNGGTAPLQYSLSGGPSQPNGTFNAVAAGNYTVTVTDDNGCTAVTNVTVGEPPVLVPNANIINTTCSLSNGTINAGSTGGFGAVQFNLNGGAWQASGSFNNLAAGNYTVTVMDAHSCTASIPAIITDAPAPVIDNIPIVNILCNGQSTGSLSIVTTGGTGALTYSINGGVAQASNSFSNLPAGAYSVLVTDANGCTVAGNVNLTQPTPLVVNTTPVATTCSNANGTITVTANGATPGYQYSLNGGANQASNVFNGLLAGNYTVTVTDQNACSATVNVVITDFPSPVITNTVVVDAACYDNDDGSVTVTVTGGTAPLSYQLNGGPSQATGTFNNLFAGAYTILVTDDNGCTATVNPVVNEPTEITMTATVITATCGYANGSITVNGSGGTGSLTYSINGGAFQNSNVFSGLSTGNYNITIHDQNGCELKSNAFVPNAPGPIITSVPATDALCAGDANGALSVHTTSGTPALLFSIDNGATTASDSVFTGLLAGNYNVIVTDANGCADTSLVTINEPLVLTGNAVTTISTCSNPNGSVIVTAAGGTANYQYALNGGPNQPSGSFSGLAAGTYDVVITDNHSCTVMVNFNITDAPGPVITSSAITNVSCFGGNDGAINTSINSGTAPISYSVNGGPGQATGNFVNLTAGNYDILVTDANGCTATSTETVTEPTQLTASATAIASTCSNANGEINVTANGGTPVYDYSLNGGPGQPGAGFTGLMAGNYNIVVTDIMGCTVPIAINVIDEPSPVIDNTAVIDVNCNSGNDGSVNVTAIGGTGALSYSIDNGVTSQGTGSFGNLIAGNYTVLVTDVNGCTVSVALSVNEPTALSSNSSSTSASCGNSDGTITVTANGGTPGYQYSIDNGTTQNPSGNYSGLTAGNYTVLVTDVHGCTINVPVAVNNTLAPVIVNAPFTDLNCFGSGDGTIQINANGGTAPLEYSIDNGTTFQPQANFNNLNAGNYQLVVQDFLGCQASLTITISEPDAVTLVSQQINTTCSANNGSITIAASGGTPGYTYSINGGATQQAGATFNNLSAGNYSALVTDSHGCTGSSNIVITDIPSPAIQNIVVVNSTCNGSDDATISISASGPASPLNFSIDNGVTFQTASLFNNLSPGNYNIVVTDTNGCTVNDVAQITEPAALSFNSSSTPASCGNSDGTLTINASGGSGNLLISIDNGITFSANTVYNNLPAATYDVVIKDANGCTFTGTGTVSNAAAPVISNTVANDISCFGLNNGTISVTANGGTGILQYSSDNGATYQATGNFSNLAPGTYNLVVEDVNGCQATASVTLTEPDELTLSSIIVNTTCSNNNGSVSLTAAGGTPNYTYSNNNGVSFQNNSVFNNLTSGNYTMVVKDANNCQTVLNVTITDAPGPVINAVNVTDISCNGAGDGVLNILTSGGTQPLSFSIDNGGTYQAGATFSNLGAGNYQVVVTDTNGCAVNSVATVAEPAAISGSYTSTNASCGNADGSATIQGSGGSGGLQYSIDNGVSFQNSGLFPSLTAGTYDVIIKDANGCQIIIAVTVNNNAAPAIQSSSYTDISCNGAGDGTISITANGGTGALNYSIDNGTTFQNGSQFMNLNPGIYNIVVTDANGCSATSIVTITEPSLLTATAAAATSTCNNANGSLNITPNGGTPGYQYSVNGGGTFVNNSSFSGLVSGSYQIVVKDANGCTFSFNKNVPSAPGPQINTVFVTDITCNGFNNGELTVIANGGTAPLQYSIDNGANYGSSLIFGSLAPGNYNVVVQDANGCTNSSMASIVQPAPINYSVAIVNANCGNSDGSLTINASGGSGTLSFSIDNGVTFQPLNTFTSLPAGTYNIVVRDGSDCTNGGPQTILNNSAPAIQNVTSADNTCNGSDDGTITIAANGGAAPLSYSIDGGFTWSASPSFSNLQPGSYSIIVQDTTGCQATASATISEPAGISASFNSTTATCGDADGTITIIASGGSGVLTFSMGGGPLQTTGQFNNLPAGNYNVVVTDVAGCSTQLATSVSNVNAPVINTVNTTNISCFNATDGSIVINASGGTGPILYSINNGLNYGSAFSFINLAAGTYNIAITDSVGCVTTDNIILTQPDELTLNAQTLDATCGNPNGTLLTLMSGGTTPVQYSINNGISFQPGGTFTGLAQGNYTVIITDANGCSATANTVVSNIPGPLFASIPVTPSMCFGSDDGTAIIQISGGTVPFQYTLGSGGNSQPGNFFGGLQPGNYNVTVVDANGCEADSSFIITEPDAVTMSVVVNNSTCSSSNAGLQISASGGTNSFTFSNNNGLTYQSDSSFTAIAAGNYDVVVIDANGCTASQQAVIIDSPGPVFQSATFTDVTCNGSANGTLSALISGGTAPVQYSIDNGSTWQAAGTFGGLNPGAYTILVADSNGCTIDSTVLILEPSALFSNASSAATLCNGSADGSASVSVTGGIAPYTYLWTGNGGTGSSATGLIAGTYSVTITDVNGCTSVASAIVTEPDAILVQHAVSDISCFGLVDGSLLLSATGGTAPMSYVWSSPAISGPGNGNLAAGIYSVTITDANGCVYNDSYTLSEPLLLTAVTTSTPALCYGTLTGNVTATPSGGVAPYSYLWSNNTTSQSAGSLAAGSYTVTISDDHGCTVVISDVVSSPDSLSVTSQSVAVTCAGSGNGSASVQVTGGTLPYSYQWNSGVTTAVISNIGGGNYTITVTDANNCQYLTVVPVYEPDPVVVAVSGDATICIGQNTLISATATGGNGGYSFLWNNNISGSSQLVNPSLTQSYSVIATDVSGCTGSSTAVVVTVNPPLSLTISPADTICEGFSATLSALATGGDGGPYQYSWTGISGNTSQITVNPGTSTAYQVSVTDGCGSPAAIASTFVVVHPLPVVNFSPVPASGCAPLDVNFDNLTITSVNGAQYDWYFGDGHNSNDFEPFHTYYEPGNYTVTLKVISSEGCSNELTVADAVQVYPVPEAALSATPPISSILYPVVTFTDLSQGASVWNWDFGDNSPFSSEQNTQHTYAETGHYAITLYVMNDFGCADTAYSEIIIEGASTVYIPNAFTPNGDGINDVFSVYGIGLNDADMTIFNRWGNVVYHSNNLKESWDGRDQFSGGDCPVDVYIYNVKVKNFKGEIQEFTGRVTLLN